MKNKDAEIPGMQLSINAIQTATNIPESMTMHELQQAMYQDQHLQHLTDFVIQGWPESTDHISQDVRRYCTFRDDMVTEKTKLLHNFIYWLGMNVDIKTT